MSHPPRLLELPMRDGVTASCVRAGRAWPTVLDFLSARLPALSRATWADRLGQGHVFDDSGQPMAAHAPCPAGLRLHYYRWLPDEPEAREPEHIVFQDEWLLIADKPHFMPVTPSGPFLRRSLLVRLRQRLGLPQLSPLHRIDRDTAGLVAFALQPATRAAYQALFRDRQVHKHYLAVAPLATGMQGPQTLRSRLQPDPERHFISREVPGPPNSESRIELLRPLSTRGPQGEPLALYRLQPITGQRHQLRLHMNALGLPLLGDAFYPQVLRPPGAPDKLDLPLQLLAQELAFSDPITGEKRHFRSRRQLLLAAGA